MTKIVAFLQLIRLPNLILIGLCQWIVATTFVEDFSSILLTGLIAATILIAISGNLINDLKDDSIDTTNKGKSKFSVIQKKTVRLAFYLTSTIGLFIGFLIATSTHWSLSLYFVAAWSILYAYAVFFSRYKIIGNILISILLALVVLVAYQTLTDLPISKAVFSYTYFAFHFNWIREVIKDIEDIKGDQLAHRNTWATLLGTQSSKWIVVVLSLLLAPPTFYIFSITNSYFILIGLGSMIATLLFCLIFTQTNTDYRRVSFLVKLFLLIGVLSPLFL